RHGLTPTVISIDQLRQLERAAAKPHLRGKRPRVPFHLKINTGMNRLGIDPGEIGTVARVLADCPHLTLEGTYTHFASADDFTSEQTQCQEKQFTAVLAKMRDLGISPGLVHMANSGAISGRSSTWADMVRPGAILYGYHQSFAPPERKEEIIGQIPLRPCLAL